MASQGLWNPVTYRIAERLGTALGEQGLQHRGRPAFPGNVEAGAGAHKYVRALYHVFRHGRLGDVGSATAALEDFSKTKGWLKFGAADEKGHILDAVVGRLKGKTSDVAPSVIVEFGTFLGYSAVRMASVVGRGSRIITMESDPEVACLAMNFVEFSGVDADIDIRIGPCEDVVPRLRDTVGARSVGLVYMDHNQMTYHEDVAQLIDHDLLSQGSLLVASQLLKPGAPMLLWYLRQAELAGRLVGPPEFISTPDCGCPMMEDWVVVAELRAAGPWQPPEAPQALRLLAAECNLMRWRTAQGLVDEASWNAFVQHVRRNVERITGIRSTRDAWPDLKVLAQARRLLHKPLDFV